MMMKPMNMGMWYPILEREKRGRISPGVAHFPVETSPCCPALPHTSLRGCKHLLNVWMGKYATPKGLC